MNYSGYAGRENIREKNFPTKLKRRYTRDFSADMFILTLVKPQFFNVFLA